MAEVVRVGLHSQAVNADDDVPLRALLFLGIRFAAAVGPGDLEHAVRNEILARAVALDDRLDKVFGHVPVIREQLLRILRQAVPAVAERRIVVIIAHARIEANALDYRGGVEALDLRKGVELVEI